MEIFRSGNPESALKYLKQTIVIAPGYSKALFEMGNCLTQLGEHEEARVRYEQAVQIDPALKKPAGKMSFGFRSSPVLFYQIQEYTGKNQACCSIGFKNCPV